MVLGLREELAYARWIVIFGVLVRAVYFLERGDVSLLGVERYQGSVANVEVISLYQTGGATSIVFHYLSVPS